MNLDSRSTAWPLASACPTLIADYRKDKPIPETVGLAVRYLVDQQRKAG